MIGLGLSLGNVAVLRRGVEAEPYTVMLLGSSTPERYFTEYTGPANANVQRSTNGSSFTAMGTMGAGAATLGDVIQKGRGGTVRLIGRGVGGSTLADWEASGSTQRSGAVAAAIAGNVDALLVIVGYNDATNSLIASKDAHKAKLRSLISKLRAEIGKSDLPIFLGMSQFRYASGYQAVDQQHDWLHEAEYEVATTDANVYFAAHAYDLAQVSDGVHQAEASYPIHATRIGRNILRQLDGQQPEKGPRATAATALTSTTTEITIAHDSGSDFTPTSGITGFKVRAGTSLLAIASAQRTSATKVLLTHASNGGTAPTVTLLEGAGPDKGAVIHDNSPAALPINIQATALASPTAGTGTPTPAPTPTPTGKSAQVNFSSTGSSANPTGWNTWGAAAASSLPANGETKALNQPGGTASGWTMVVVSRPYGGAESGTLSMSGYPNSVLGNFWYTDSTITSSTLRLTGLDSTKTYTLEMVPSRSGAAPPRPTIYTVNDRPAQSIEAASNTTSKALFENVAPVNGAITITFGNGAGSTFGYLNGMIIVEMTA
ncbi:SGNH/GDSL hydrolase family protein [Croceibacterium ferulae]|uniref:SGNH/GDSL hydrolase family protein n=1 Tax=Croceibacterium ferulae TaxID=1854641 RepID=UPI000EB504BE|nr:SGNH/GDSL hydrolase family protein [Croceibacterium ferulae]